MISHARRGGHPTSASVSASIDVRVQPDEIDRRFRVAMARPPIRPAGPADHALMLELWERSVRATHGFLTEKDIVELRPHVARGFESSAVEWFVACDEGDQAIGFLAYRSGCIEGLFVDPRHHRRGIGGFLVAYAQALAVGPLRLDVNEGNPGAIDFYRSQGFVVVGRSPTDGEGRPFPILHMKRSAAP